MIVEKSQMQKRQQIGIKTNVKHCDYVATVVANSGDRGSNLACSLWPRTVVLDALSTEHVPFCMRCLLWLEVCGHLSSLGLTSPLTSRSLRACLPTMYVCTYVWKSEVNLRRCPYCFSKTRSLLGLELTYLTGLAAYKAPGSQRAARVHLPVLWWQDCAMVLGMDLRCSSLLTSTLPTELSLHPCLFSQQSYSQ